MAETTHLPDTPDLSFYLVIHRALRTSAAQLGGALASLDPGDRRRARALERWFVGYTDELHHHHTVEDEIFFPALAGRVPTYTAHAQGIADDHALLGDLLGALGVVLRALAGGDGRELAEARAITARLQQHLDEHLAVEDAEILPLFARHFSVAEYEGFHDAAMKQLRPKQAMFTCPWLMSYLDDGERGALLARAPLPLKLTWYATRRGYARRTRVALGARCTA